MRFGEDYKAQIEGKRLYGNDEYLDVWFNKWLRRNPNLISHQHEWKRDPDFRHQPLSKRKRSDSIDLTTSAPRSKADNSISHTPDNTPSENFTTADSTALENSTPADLTAADSTVAEAAAMESTVAEKVTTTSFTPEVITQFWI